MVPPSSHNLKTCIYMHLLLATYTQHQTPLITFLVRSANYICLIFCVFESEIDHQSVNQVYMDIIHTFLNFVVPPFTFISLCLLLPPYFFYKTLRSVFSTFFSESVAGRVVLITGASSGIGENLAYEYAKRGAFLALVGRRGSQLNEVAAIAREIGSPDVITITADVQQVDDCKSMVEATINHFGSLDHLVNNAGINSMCPFEECTDITNFRKVVDTNFWGSVYATRFAIPYLKESRGKIIAVSSFVSWLPLPRMSFYNASKAAMVGFFETLRIELGSDVHVLIVTPGFVESEMSQGKAVMKHGELDYVEHTKDIEFPEESTESCARAIVNSACRGDKYLTEPAWYRVTWLWKVFAPDVVEWGCRFMYLAKQKELGREGSQLLKTE